MFFLRETGAFKSKKTDPQIAAMLSLMAGATVKLADIFQEVTLNNTEYKSVSFSDSEFSKLLF